MCGIFAVFNDTEYDKYETNFNDGKNRGPDNFDFPHYFRKGITRFSSSFHQWFKQ